MMAYYCSPFKGSDWRVGWGRAVYAARTFVVTVITSGQSRTDIEKYIDLHGPIQNLTFAYVDDEGPGALKAIRFSYLYINPLSYSRWLRKAYQLAEGLHASHSFDLAHQVNLIGFREPGELWRLDIPFVWGPIGGTQCLPWKFLASGGWKDTVLEGFRSVLNVMQVRFSPKVHTALRRSSAVLVANSHGLESFRKYRPDCIRLLETGLEKVGEPKPAGDPRKPLRILWSGEIHFRKALHLLLLALGQIGNEIQFEVHILGRGKGLAQARKMAAKLGVADRCQFLGWLSLDEAMKQSRWADIFVFTSLRDTSGNVMLEAMSEGVPVITFNHQGAGDIVTDKSGIKLPVTTPADAVTRLAQAITLVGSNREYLARLSDGAVSRAKEYLWERNAEVMAGVYHSVLPPAVTTGSLSMSEINAGR